MKKSGDKVKQIAIHGAFILAIILGLYFIASSSVNLTGYAVLDASTAKSKLESALSSSSIFSQVEQTSICVIINDPEQPLSLQAQKFGSDWTVSEMVDYCSGITSEDLIVQFSSYDSFSKAVDNPSPRLLAQAAMDQDFHVLQSRYVELGGNVVCDATFKVKFCGAASSMASNEQLIDGDLVCCIDTLTKEDRQLLEQHLQEGNYQDEIGILEQPSPGIAGFSMTTSIAMLGGLLLVIIVIILVFTMGKSKPAVESKMPKQPMPMMQQPTTQNIMQPQQASRSKEVSELKTYIVQALGEGYEPEEIMEHLLQIGWDQQTAQQVLSDATRERLRPN